MQVGWNAVGVVGNEVDEVFPLRKACPELSTTRLRDPKMAVSPTLPTYVE
jgi:hypothetical protein